MTDRETFEQFLKRRSEFAPITGERMSSVRDKQYRAFVAYVDEQVGDLAQLRDDVDRIKALLVL